MIDDVRFQIYDLDYVLSENPFLNSNSIAISIYSIAH